MHPVVSPRIQKRLAPVTDFVSPVIKRYGLLNISLVSGGMAYYVMLALAPMAIAIGAIVGLFVNEQKVADAWDSLVARNSETLQVFDPAVTALTDLAATSSTGAVTVTTISSAILAIYVSQKVVYGVRNVEDQIFRRENVAQGIVIRAWSALAALLGIVGIVALLLALTILPQVLSALGVATAVSTVLSYTQWILPVAFVYFFVWLILARVTRGSGRISWVSPGLVIATVWIVGSVGVFGLYANLSATVGSALVVFGAPIAILIWTFLVFMGFFLGSLVQAEIYSASSGANSKTTEEDQQQGP